MVSFLRESIPKMDAMTDKTLPPVPASESMSDSKAPEVGLASGVGSHEQRWPLGNIVPDCGRM